MLKDKKIKLLYEYVDTVKDLMKRNGINVPFFIAGGSVYSVLKGLNDFADIDVFFYNLEDHSKIDNIKVNENVNDDLLVHMYGLYKTDNATSISAEALLSTYKIDINKDIQFINRRVGNVDDVLNSFDINCSRIAITSDYEVIYKVSLDDDIVLDMDNFKSNTMYRYRKYIKNKNAKDPNSTMLTRALYHLVDNFYNVIPKSYKGENLSSFSIITSTHYAEEEKYFKLIHDIVCEKFTGYDRIKAFTDLNIIVNDYANCCEEYICYMLLNTGISHHVVIPDLELYNNKEIYDVKQIISAKMMYPELFI